MAIKTYNFFMGTKSTYCVQKCNKSMLTSATLYYLLQAAFNFPFTVTNYRQELFTRKLEYTTKQKVAVQ